MLHHVASVADRAVAREHAVSIASLVGASMRPRRRIVLGEPDCPYELRWNTEHLWFGAQISDVAFVVRGNHRRRFQSAIDFYASFKASNQVMGTTIALHPLSDEIGVKVFVADAKAGASATAALRSDTCSAIVARVDFASIHSMFLSPVQLYAILDLDSREQCAEQIRVLRSLLLAVSQQSPQDV